MISPVNHMNIRIDGKGSGLFGAPRGWRLHQGIDLEADVGSDIFAPEDGKLIRVMLPYGKNDFMRGLILKAREIIHKLTYVEILSTDLIGKRVKEGDKLGILQDIRLKYGRDVKPHLHWETILDPTVTLKLFGSEGG